MIGLLTDILGEAPEREKRYSWVVGDPSPKTGRVVQLPFDAVWESRRLIVEIDEDQHRKAVAHFDKPDRLTVSGVHRGEQRKLYGNRKRAAARGRGYTVVEIPWERHPAPGRRSVAADVQLLRRILEDAGVPLSTDC